MRSSTSLPTPIATPLSTFSSGSFTNDMNIRQWSPHRSPGRAMCAKPTWVVAVITDCKSHKVVVKEEKADLLKVFERIKRKSPRQVELFPLILKPPEEKKVQDEEKPKPKPEERKEEVLVLHLTWPVAVLVSL
ncbi:hypothetical protein E2542_SST04368 [Spatholobus suberectus]|nr:hypothetical protein E2542_SST04368 [Spatholobus suberectus]